MEHATARPTAAGDVSFDDLFDEHYESVLRAMWLLTGDRQDAEDLTQEAFARLFEHQSRIARERNVAGYVYRTAVNLHRSRLRRVRVARRKRADVVRDLQDPLASTDDRDQLRRALATLNSSEREALVAVEWLDLSAEEAGDLLGASPGAIRTRVSRAKAHLRDNVRLEGSDDERS